MRSKSSNDVILASAASVPDNCITTGLVSSDKVRAETESCQNDSDGVNVTVGDRKLAQKVKSEDDLKRGRQHSYNQRLKKVQERMSFEEQAESIGYEMELHDQHIEMQYELHHSVATVAQSHVMTLVQSIFCCSMSASNQSLHDFTSQGFVLTMPKVNLFYCKPTSVETERFRFVGCKALESFVEGNRMIGMQLAHEAHRLAVESLLTEVSLDKKSFLLENNDIQCKFTITTVNAVLCGGTREISYTVMLHATIGQPVALPGSSALQMIDTQCLLTADLFFDALDVTEQYSSCFGALAVGQQSVERILSLAQQMGDGYFSACQEVSHLDDFPQEYQEGSRVYQSASRAAVSTQDLNIVSFMTPAELSYDGVFVGCRIVTPDGTETSELVEGNSENGSHFALAAGGLDIEELSSCWNDYIPTAVITKEPLSSLVNVARTDPRLLPVLPAAVAADRPLKHTIQVFPLFDKVGETPATTSGNLHTTVTQEPQHLLWRIASTHALSDTELLMHLINTCVCFIVSEMRRAVDDKHTVTCDCPEGVKMRCPYHCAVEEIQSQTQELLLRSLESAPGGTSNMDTCVNHLQAFLTLVDSIEQSFGLTCSTSSTSSVGHRDIPESASDGGNSSRSMPQLTIVTHDSSVDDFNSPPRPRVKLSPTSVSVNGLSTTTASAISATNTTSNAVNGSSGSSGSSRPVSVTISGPSTLTSTSHTTLSTAAEYLSDATVNGVGLLSLPSLKSLGSCADFEFQQAPLLTYGGLDYQPLHLLLPPQPDDLTEQAYQMFVEDIERISEVLSSRSGGSSPASSPLSSLYSVDCESELTEIAVASRAVTTFFYGARRSNLFVPLTALLAPAAATATNPQFAVGLTRFLDLLRTRHTNIKIQSVMQEALIHMSQSSQDVGECSAAIVLFTQVIAIDPTFVDAIMHRSSAYARTGDFVACLQDIQKVVLELEPTNYKALFAKGLLFLHHCMYEDAQNILQLALSINPQLWLENDMQKALLRCQSGIMRSFGQTLVPQHQSTATQAQH